MASIEPIEPDEWQTQFLLLRQRQMAEILAAYGYGPDATDLRCETCKSGILNTTEELLAFETARMCSTCAAWRTAVRRKCAISKCLEDGGATMVNSQGVRVVVCRGHATKITSAATEWREE